MQREISHRVSLGQTVSPFGDACSSSANHTDAKEKVKKIRELINAGKYDEGIAKCIP